MGSTSARDPIRFAYRRITFGCIVASCALASGVANGGDYTDLLRRGDEAREAGELLTAVSLFREAIRDQPQNPTAYIKAAEAYGDAFEGWGLRNDDLAGVSLWIAPDDWRKHVEPTFCFSILGEQGIPKEPRYDRTVPIEVFHQRALAEKATQLAPDDSSAWRWLGEAYFAVRRVFDEEGDYDLEADRCFGRAVELAPEDAALRNRIGRIDVELQRAAQALPHFDAAIRLAPEKSEYLLDRCSCLVKLGDISGTTRDLKVFGIAPEGVAEIERRAAAFDPTTLPLQWSTILSRYVKLHPEDAFPVAARAQLFRNLKDYEYALRDIELALTIEPQHPAFLVFRADLLRRLGRHGDALEAADQAQQLRPYNPVIETLQATCLNELGRIKEAQRSKRRIELLQDWLKFREAAEQTSDDAGIWLEGGRLALNLYEWAAAKTCFGRAAESAQNAQKQFADAGLATAHLALAEFKDAADAATRAIDAEHASESTAPRGATGDPVELSDFQLMRETVTIRAAARLGLGDFDGAIADYESIQTVGPDIVNAYRMRAEHRESQGDAAGAAEDRKHAEELQRNPFDVPGAEQ